MIIPFIGISQISADDIYKFYRASLLQLNKVEYSVVKTDTFTDGTIWNLEGKALIEFNPTGFDFIGVNGTTKSALSRIGEEVLYMHFEDSTYEKEDNEWRGLSGMTGGQMVGEVFVNPYEEFRKVSLIDSTNYYVIKLLYPNFDGTEPDSRYEVIWLDKSSYLPTKKRFQYVYLGEYGSHQLEFFNLKTNSDVKQSVAFVTDKHLEGLNLVSREEISYDHLLGLTFPSIEAINNNGDSIAIKENKVTIIDIWEIWCGPCVSSLKEVDSLQKRHLNDFEVIGLTSSDKAKSQLILNKKEIEFDTYYTSEADLDQIPVKSVPLYIIIDKNRVIQKVYRGYHIEMEEYAMSLVNE